MKQLCLPSADAVTCAFATLSRAATRRSSAAVATPRLEGAYSARLACAITRPLAVDHLSLPPCYSRVRWAVDESHETHDRCQPRPRDASMPVSPTCWCRVHMCCFAGARSLRWLDQQIAGLGTCGVFAPPLAGRRLTLAPSLAFDSQHACLTAAWMRGRSSATIGGGYFNTASAECVSPAPPPPNEGACVSIPLCLYLRAAITTVMNSSRLRFLQRLRVRRDD